MQMDFDRTHGHAHTYGVGVRTSPAIIFPWHTTAHHSVQLCQATQHTLSPQRRHPTTLPPRHFQRLIHAERPQARLGVGGFMGNKGGLVVKLDFGQTSLVFVSSHLAAHSLVVVWQLRQRWHWLPHRYPQPLELPGA